jgi:spore maturation protein CgeB
MFLIQKGDAIKAVEAAGAGKAIYLPVGCDPEMHKPIVLSPADKARWGSEISFVGAGYNNRVQTFASLANRNFKIWGTEWPTVPPFTHLVQEEARRLSVEEYVNIFNASTININLHSSSERDGVEPNGDFVNPRTFELAAAGAFQLVDNRKYLPEMFEVGKEVITFFDRRELTEKIDYYLAHPEERVKVTTAARERVLRDHTYQQRLKQLLGHIYADRYEELKSRTNNDVSAKMIRSAKSVPELQQRLQQVVDSGGELSLDAMSMEIFKRGGKLDEVDKKLLFLKHIKTEIQHVKKSFQTARK